ncbi:MAG: GAF domain-containing protein [Bacteroidia bacterium]|nr:GAF domain-containing protein [Bacteroidia bacterium]
MESIGEGKLDLDYKDLEPEYQAGRNKLADSLIAMQAKLKTINEEDGKRKWANEGVNKFVEILRSSDNNIQKLGDRIISSLVQYTGANQGGLYILNDEDPGEKFLELVSLFAFDIKKFEKQRVKPGEGFLGQTFLERETTYLKELPQDYVRITSGLGSTNPSAVLIVPLKLDLQVYGVVELASFRQFQPHEISFVERLGETIASTLASVKAADRNHRLLEESKIATEAMRSQEEEMRQNMEELQATQEEMARKEKDYVAQIETLEARVQGAVPKLHCSNSAASNNKKTRRTRRASANWRHASKTHLHKKSGWL